MVAMDKRSGTLAVSRRTKHTFSKKQGQGIMLPSRNVSAPGLYCHHIYFLRHIHLAPMPKMDLIELCIEFRIKATWKPNIFIPSLIDCSIRKTKSIPKLIALDGHGSPVSECTLTLLTTSPKPYF